MWIQCLINIYTFSSWIEQIGLFQVPRSEVSTKQRELRWARTHKSYLLSNLKMKRIPAWSFSEHSRHVVKTHSIQCNLKTADWNRASFDKNIIYITVQIDIQYGPKNHLEPIRVFHMKIGTLQTFIFIFKNLQWFCSWISWVQSQFVHIQMMHHRMYIILYVPPKNTWLKCLVTLQEKRGIRSKGAEAFALHNGVERRSVFCAARCVF